MSVWDYAEGVADVPERFRLTLGEGRTPMVWSRRLGRACGLERLGLKLESANPTGSFKDRFAAVAVSHMLATDTKLCLATSSGNTGAALAAYTAAAGIPCRIAIVETAPRDKLAQMLAYGARLARIRGFGTDPRITSAVFDELEQLAQRPGTALQISAFRYSPFGMTGVRSIGYELAGISGSVGAGTSPEGSPPDHVFCPAGGGGLALAVAQAFLHLAERGLAERVPQVHCVQPAGNDTIASALREGADRARPVACATAISGLQVASVVDGDAVIEACRLTGGTGHVVSDDDVWAIQKRLARDEGIFTEPAGAVSVAGAIAALGEGRVAPADSVVCLVTGIGFKDATSIERMNQDLACPLVDDVASWAS